MGRHSLDKLAATHLLEAVKAAQAHLSRLKISAGELGTSDHKDLVPIYGRVRRLRDYLQRCVAAYSSASVDVELCDADCDLLCSCLIHDLGQVDERLAENPPERERSWLLEKAKNHQTLAVVLATQRVDELPRRPGPISPRMREALIRVRHKLTPQGKDASAIYYGGGLQIQGTAAGSEQENGPEGDWKVTATDVAVADSEKSATPEAVKQVAPVRLIEADAVHSGQVIDPNRIRDPRLRTMLALDLRAHQRAIHAEDFRLAAIHVASMLEGAVLDYALPRVAELGLEGAPESWRIDVILGTAIEDLSARDRAMLLHLMGTMNMIRPARQLREPVVVTGKILAEMTTLVHRVLATLGFVGSARAVK